MNKITAQLMRDEGCIKNPQGEHVLYRCTSGKRTIGYGHNLDANPIPGVSDTISEEYARDILADDIADVCEELDARLAWASSLDRARYGVLVNMAFNLGIAGLMTFKNTLAYIQTGNYAMAASNMGQSIWASQVGKRATRLMRQMETGEWQ